MVRSGARNRDGEVVVTAVAARPFDDDTMRLIL
jgi:hypothetical protein